MEKGEKIGTISIYDNQQLLYTFDMHLSQDLSFSMLERVAYYGSIVVIVGGMITVLVVVKRKRSQK